MLWNKTTNVLIWGNTNPTKCEKCWSALVEDTLNLILSGLPPVVSEMHHFFPHNRAQKTKSHFSTLYSSKRRPLPGLPDHLWNSGDRVRHMNWHPSVSPVVLTGTKPPVVLILECGNLVPFDLHSGLIPEQFVTNSQTVCNRKTLLQITSLQSVA